MDGWSDGKEERIENRGRKMKCLGWKINRVIVKRVG